MDSYGFLWIPMDSYGFLWIPIDSYGFLWIHMDSMDYPGLFANSDEALACSPSGTAQFVAITFFTAPVNYSLLSVYWIYIYT
jgi:hypothetical protein